MSETNWHKALGPLAPLFTDPEITEIMVDAPDRVLVERHNKLEESGVRFDAPQALLEVIQEALALGGVTLGPGETIGDVRLPDGSSRMLAVLSPTALNGPVLVIRKFQATGITWDKLLEWGFVTPEALDLLRSALHAHLNLLLSGGPGCGKTTIASLLAEQIPAEERLVVVEAAHELQIRHPRAIFLEAGGPANLSLGEVVSAGSRMRPDWLIVGELHSGAAAQVLDLLSRGHVGMATIHANSPEDALTRLESLCLMANLGLGLGEIRALIASALRVVTYQERMPAGNRRMLQIVEVAGLENDRYVLQPLFRYNPETERLEATGIKPGWL